MEADDDKRKAEKKARSEAQRIASIQAKRELEKKRKLILSQALREVDQKSKRVVFADSDDSEEDAPSSSQDYSQRPSSTAHVKLFEESSSDCEEEDIINITNRHEGKEGEKLMKLEARYNSDSRFKLDEKFVSSGSEYEEENEVVQERTKHLEVLSRVLGSTVKPRKNTLKSSKKDGKRLPKVRPFTRFDPFNEEHVQWLKREEENNETNLEHSSDNSDEASEVDESKNDTKTNSIHYEMQSEFAEELKAHLAAETPATKSANGSAGFSFLAMIGRKAPPTREKCSYDQEVDIVPNKKLKKIVGDFDDDEGIDAKVAVPPASAHLSRLATTRFFVTGDEQHLSSLVSNFKRTQPLEKIVPQWANHRDVFAKNYRHLRKMALKQDRHKLLQSNGRNGEKKGKSFPMKREQKTNEV